MITTSAPPVSVRSRRLRGRRRRRRRAQPRSLPDGGAFTRGGRRAPAAGSALGRTRGGIPGGRGSGRQLLRRADRDRYRCAQMGRRGRRDRRPLHPGGRPGSGIAALRRRLPGWSLRRRRSRLIDVVDFAFYLVFGGIFLVGVRFTAWASSSRRRPRSGGGRSDRDTRRADGPAACHHRGGAAVDRSGGGRLPSQSPAGTSR